MKGSFEVIVKNRRIQYKFTICRNITILKGDSATGKTTLIIFEINDGFHLLILFIQEIRKLERFTQY